MNTAAIHHEAHGAMAYRVGPYDLRVVLRTARGDIKGVTAVFGDRYTGVEGERHTNLQLSGHSLQHDYWTAVFHLKTRRFRYAFLLDDGRHRVWYGEDGFREERPETWRSGGYFHYPYLHQDADAEPPPWSCDAVYYQIFLDRFDNGETANDPPFAGRWGGKPSFVSVFGGDLAGVCRRLDYLLDLGVNCLYLTPIFLAPSNHKYDTTDYYHIDPAFGDEEDARRLVSEAHARGIRVILDAVFNHCGARFPYFQDVVANGERSRYAGWFHFESLPVRPGHQPNYETFGHNIAGMPKLATGNPEVREYLVGAAEHWTGLLDIDGWRLDVANEVHPELWRELRWRVRKVKPDAILVGEIAHEARPWLEGDQMDCVMNYPFRETCLDFFAYRTLDVPRFIGLLTAQRFRYRESANRAQLNLLGSHDTPRLLTVFGGDRRRVKLALLFQFTYLGAPYIYYGDEVGLTGGDDPECRGCMVWDPAKQDTGLLGYYRGLMDLRRRWSAIRRGDLAFLEIGAVLTFLRWDKTTAALIVLNNTETETRLPVKRLLAGTVGFLGAALGPERWAVAWKVEEAAGSDPHDANGFAAPVGEDVPYATQVSTELLTGEYLLLRPLSGYAFVAMRQPIDL